MRGVGCKNRWRCRANSCYRKGSALSPNCVATGRQPYTTPGETTLAPVPIAIELESPPSRSIPSLAPRSASVWNINLGEKCVPTAKNKSLRGKSMATAVRPRHRELCLCCLVRRQVGRQLVVEPQHELRCDLPLRVPRHWPDRRTGAANWI